MKHLVRKFRDYWVEDISFIALLGILIFTIFIMPTILELGWAGVTLLNITFSTIFFVGIWSSLQKRWMVVNSFLFCLYVVLKLIRFSESPLIPGDYLILENLVASLNMVSFIYINLTLLFRDQEFNFYRVIGAVNVYLLIGLLGAFMFEMIHQMFGTSITCKTLTTGGHEDFSEYIYFSMVSITTVGYGDITPVHPAAKMLAVFLSAVGILFPAVVIAKLASLSK